MCIEDTGCFGLIFKGFLKLISGTMRKLSPTEMSMLETLREYSRMVMVNTLGRMELSMRVTGNMEK